MKYVIEVPDYDPKCGVGLVWEDNFEISTSTDPYGTFVIKANPDGLISLANHLLALAQPTVPAGSHIHLDDYGGFEEGSQELILMRG